MKNSIRINKVVTEVKPPLKKGVVIMIKKYFDGLKFGMLLQLAVGPMCLMVFNTAKNVSFLVALSLVLAIALVDAFYILLAGLGVSKLIVINQFILVLFSFIWINSFLKSLKL